MACSSASLSSSSRWLWGSINSSPTLLSSPAGCPATPALCWPAGAGCHIDHWARQRVNNTADAANLVHDQLADGVEVGGFHATGCLGPPAQYGARATVGPHLF